MRFIAELDETKVTHFVAGDFSYSTNPDVWDWLDSKKGQGYSVAFSNQNYGIVGLHFYNEQDAMWFTLRWA